MFSTREILVGISALLCWMKTSTSAQALTVEDDFVKTPTKTKVRREHNLDHWDSDTLAYYLDEYPGYDLAVLFYAPWDENSHRLAPYWGRIAQILDAGSSQSKLIMSLFDCELNSSHMQLCKAAGITHYPTLLFIGSGPFYDTDPVSKVLFGKKSAGVMGEAPVSNTVKFQGNWQYYDSILDWIKTMQALSRWHTWSTKGFGKRLRNFFLPERKQNKQLPLGVPKKSSGISSIANSGASYDSTTTTDANVAFLEKQIQETTKVAKREATMLDSVLFGDENSTDIFTLLDERDAWKDMNSYNDLNDVYRNCAMEVSLDFCQRVADSVGTKVVDKLIASSNLSSEELMKASENIEALISDELKTEEPYCGTLDNCIATDMKDESCRPKTCPFVNTLACRFTNSCMEPSVVVDYAEALGLDIDSLLKSPSSKGGAKESGTKRGWGF